MSSEQDNATDPKSHNRIVAFVDILGASQAAISGDSADLVGKIFRLGRTMRWTHNIHLNRADGTKEKQVFKPGVAQFSDCLLLWSDPLEGLSPEQFVRSVGSFLWNFSAELGRLILADVPFRAGVSEGPVFIYPELNIFAGSPIVEAVKLESCQEWLGAAMLFADRPDRLIRRPDQICTNYYRPIFEHYVMPELQPPLKKESPDFLLKNSVIAINWALSSQESGGPTYQDFRRKIILMRDKIEVPNIQCKYDMALDFIYNIEKIHPDTKYGAID